MTVPLATRTLGTKLLTDGVALTAEQRQRVQRRTVAVLAASTILGGLGAGAALSVGALLLAEVSGNDAISGLASAMFNAGAALAGIPLARLAARKGRRRAMISGNLVAMFGALIAIFGSVIGQWWVLALGISMVGVASAVQLLSRFAATDLALPKNRARDLSLVVWAITVGAVVGPNLLGPGAIVGAALGLTPFTAVFVFPFIAQSLAALVSWIGLRPDPLLTARASAVADAAAETKVAETEAAETEVTATEVTATEVTAAEKIEVDAVDTLAEGQAQVSPVQAASLPKASRTPLLLTILLIAMAQAIMVALMAMTPLHLMHTNGTPELVGFTLSLHIAGMYALSPLFGFLAGRIGRLPTIAIGWVVLLISIVFAFFAGPSHVMVQIALTLVGVGWGLVTVAGAALLTELAPLAERPIWQGRSDTFMSAAGAVAGALAGVVFALGSFSSLALVSGGLLTLGVIASVRVGRSKRSDGRAPIFETV